MWPGKPWTGSREVNKSWHRERSELADILMPWAWTKYWQHTELGYFCIDVFRILNWLFKNKCISLFIYLFYCHQLLLLLLTSDSIATWTYFFNRKGCTFSPENFMFWVSLFMNHGNIINIHSEQKNSFYCIHNHWMSHLIPFLPITLSTHSPGPFTPSKQRACSGKYNNVSWENKQFLAAREIQHQCFEWWHGDRTFSMCFRGVPATVSLTY